MKLQTNNTIHQKTAIRTTLSPQLVANIQLLTLPSDELLDALQKEVATNPLLELEKEEEDDGVNLEPTTEPWEASDTDWSYKNVTRDRTILPQPIEEQPSLQSYLEWQAQLTYYDPLEFAIAMVIIDSIDEQGFLTCSFEQIAATLKLSDDKLATIAAVQQRMLAFEPLGVSARSAEEYLLCQLDHTAKQHPDYPLARSLVLNALIALSQHDMKRLRTITHAPADSITAAITLIRSLPPFPCAHYSYQTLEPITPPDLYIVSQQGRWLVRVNPRFAYRLNIDAAYTRIVREAGSHYPQIKEQLKQAQWLQKGLLHRQDSLLRVAEYIIEYQKAFFHEGPQGLAPLTLAAISAKTALHISSVSRIVQNKTIQTPRGVFALSYFLTSGHDDGVEPITKRACLAVLKDLVDKEPKETPYSDETLREKLVAQGITLSRRAIAKYRQQLGIAATYMRKRHTGI